MTTTPETSTEALTTSRFPDKRITVEVYEEPDGRYVAVSKRDGKCRGIGETVPGAVEAYARAVRTGADEVTIDG